MLRLPFRNTLALLCPALETVSAKPPLVTTEAESSGSNHQQEEHDKQQQESEQQAQLPSFFFASGHAIPPPVVRVMVQQQQQQLVQKKSATSKKTDSTSHSFKSPVWFTVHQCQMMRIKIKDGEQPMRVDCPPGSTRKPHLTLFNADQTLQPNFFPSVLKGSAATYKKERELQMAMARSQKTQQQGGDDKNDDRHQDQSLQQSLNVDDAIKPLPMSMITEDGGAGALTPQFVGGSAIVAPNNAQAADMQNNMNNDHHNHININNNNNNNTPPVPREMPRHMWSVLASVAAQHGWTSPYWYTRSGMRNVCMTPKTRHWCVSRSGATALPLVVRMHHNKKVTSVPQYQHVWNADQLEPIGAADSADAVAAASASQSNDNDDEHGLSAKAEEEHDDAQISAKLDALDDLPTTADEHHSNNKGAVEAEKKAAKKGVDKVDDDMCLVGPDSAEEPDALFAESSSSSSSNNNALHFGDEGEDVLIKGETPLAADGTDPDALAC